MDVLNRIIMEKLRKLKIERESEQMLYVFLRKGRKSNNHGHNPQRGVAERYSTGDRSGLS